MSGLLSWNLALVTVNRGKLEYGQDVVLNTNVHSVLLLAIVASESPKTPEQSAARTSIHGRLKFSTVDLYCMVSFQIGLRTERHTALHKVPRSFFSNRQVGIKARFTIFTCADDLERSGGSKGLQKWNILTIIEGYSNEMRSLPERK